MSFRVAVGGSPSCFEFFPRASHFSQPGVIRKTFSEEGGGGPDVGGDTDGTG